MLNGLEKIDFRNTNRPLDVILHWRKDSGREGLLLDPPYQRGDVWGLKRRRNLIRSLLMAIPIPSIIINQRLLTDTWGNDYRIAVIDGRQRITTVFKFVDGEFSVPAEWFAERDVIEQKDGEVFFSGLAIPRQRKLLNGPVAFCEARAENLEQEQHIFELINFGGLAQGEVDQD